MDEGHVHMSSHPSRVFLAEPGLLMARRVQRVSGPNAWIRHVSDHEKLNAAKKEPGGRSQLYIPDSAEIAHCTVHDLSLPPRLLRNLTQMAASSSTVTPAEHTMIGALGGGVEVCIMQPLVGIKNALQEGRPVPRNPMHLYRGLTVSPPYTAVPRACQPCS